MGKVIDFTTARSAQEIETKIFISSNNEPTVNIIEHAENIVIWIEAPDYAAVDQLYKRGLSLLKQRTVAAVTN